MRNWLLSVHLWQAGVKNQRISSQAKCAQLLDSDHTMCDRLDHERLVSQHLSASKIGLMPPPWLQTSTCQEVRRLSMSNWYGPVPSNLQKRQCPHSKWPSLGPVEIGDKFPPHGSLKSSSALSNLDLHMHPRLHPPKGAGWFLLEGKHCFAASLLRPVSTLASAEYFSFSSGEQACRDREHFFCSAFHLSVDTCLLSNHLRWKTFHPDTKRHVGAGFVYCIILLKYC